MLVLQGLLAGAAHVLTGPDHLVGVAPLAVDRDPSVRPARIGATWGLGHGLGVVILGVLGQTLMSAAQVDVASVWAERLVGIVLIGLGALTVVRARSVVVHEHRHQHDEGEEHVHLHVHPKGHTHVKAEHGHRHAAFGIGLIHGLAGAGHFWAALPSLAMSRGDAAIYLTSYLVASLALMTVFGAVLGRCSNAMGVAWLPKFLTTVGLITIGIGAWWVTLAFGLV